MLAQVAEDAGVPVNVGCGEGQCGACEMEIKKEGGAGDAFVVRSCVTTVPRAELIAQGGEHWEVSTEFDFGSITFGRHRRTFARDGVCSNLEFHCSTPRTKTTVQ